MKSKRLAFIASLTLVLLFLAFALLWRRAPAPAPAPSAAIAASAAAPPVRGARGTVRAPLRLQEAKAARDEAAGQGVFEGRVIDVGTAKGVTGAELTFAHEGTTTRVMSGEDGRFRVAAAEPGRYELAMATAAGYLPFAPSFGESPIAWTARPGERVYGITIALTPAVAYTGVVLDPNQKPVAGASVRVLSAEGEATLQGGAASSVRSDDKGEFRVAAPDEALIEATHPDFAKGRARVDFTAQVSRTLIIQLGPKSGEATEGLISGKVVDDKGAPIEGANVQAFLEDQAREAPLSVAPRAQSDEKGQFEIEGLAPGGRYRVVASAPPLAPAEVKGLSAGASDVVLALARGGSLAGSVRDGATGDPVVAFTVVVSARVGPLELSPFTEQTFYDAQGRYEIDGLGPGNYVVTAAARGYAPSAEASVTIADPPGEVRRDFSLGKGGRVTGKVMDGDERTPIEGARVWLEGRLGSGPDGAPLLTSARTDATGQFTLEGLGEGIHSIRVEATGHHARIISGLVVAEGATLGPLTVELTPLAPGEKPRVELVGIGAVLSAKDDALVIQQVVPGGGAAEAGLGAGDAIVSIDGQAVSELGFGGAIERIRGPEGSRVVLGLRRGEDKAVVEVEVFRRRLRGP